MRIELKYAIVMSLTKWVAIISLIFLTSFEAGLIVGLTFLLIFINLEVLLGDVEQIIKALMVKDENQES